MELFESEGEEFYFDLDRINEFVKIDEEPKKNLEDLLTKEEEETEKKELTEQELYELSQGPMIDMTKWELVKGMIEVVLSEQSIVDEDMGITMLGKQLSIPTRLCFNTLMKHKLIKTNK